MKSHISTIHNDLAQQRTVLLWGRDCSAGLDVHIKTSLKMISLDSMLTRKFSGSSFDLPSNQKPGRERELPWWVYRRYCFSESTEFPLEINTCTWTERRAQRHTHVQIETYYAIKVETQITVKGTSCLGDVGKTGSPYGRKFLNKISQRQWDIKFTSIRLFS